MATHDVQGIYEIKNLKNDKVYVGSSKNIYDRWRVHKRDLRKNKHHNQHLQNAWNQHSEESFKFSILEEVNDPTLLLERESHHCIEKKSLNSEYGYNTELPKDIIKRIELKNLGRNNKDCNKLKRAQPIVQVDTTTGKIIKRFANRLEIRDNLPITKKQLDKSLEVNIFKARSHQSRILHPINNYILMYEKFYQQDYDYKSAIKVGELVKVSRGDYQETLTKYEFENLVGKKVNDYTWPRLRTISYKEGSTNHLGYTLTFLRKPLTDNPKEPEMKVVDLTPKPIPEKFCSKGTIIGLRDQTEIHRFDSLTEMATQLGFSYKQATRLLAKDSSKKGGKKTWKGVVFYYEKDL